jgi:sarcosine oxidase subunit gamma
VTAEQALRRSPLVSGLPAGSPETVLLREVGWRTLVEFRLATAQNGSGGSGGSQEAGADTASAEAVLGLALPTGGRAGMHGDRLAVWLGPGWWLLDWPDEVDRDAELDPPLVHRLRAAGGRLSAVEVSAGFAVLELTGPHASAVLAHGCSIDLYPRAFGVGSAARTMLAKAQVVLTQTDDAPTYRLWVRSSFARYLVAWLLDAATEYLAS